MRNFILNHASLAFWIWCVPPFLWLLSTLPAEASLEEAYLRPAADLDVDAAGRSGHQLVFPPAPLAGREVHG